MHRLYKNQAAVTANPYTLRQFSMAGPNGTSAPPKSIGFAAILEGATSGPPPARYSSREDRAARKRSDSPPRAAFKCVNTGRGFGGQRGYSTDTVLLLRR